jgi:hypothetical protein
MMSRLPDAAFVRLGDVVRWSGRSRRTVMRTLRLRCRRVVPRGCVRGVYARDEVLAAFSECGGEGGGGRGCRRN